MLLLDTQKCNPDIMQIMFLGWLNNLLKDYAIILSNIGLRTSIIYKDKYFEEHEIVSCGVCYVHKEQ